MICWLLRMYAHWKLFSGSKHEPIITFNIVLESKNLIYSLLNFVCCKTSCDGGSLRFELKYTWLVDFHGCMLTENRFRLTKWTNNHVYCSSGVKEMFLAEFRLLRNFLRRPTAQVWGEAWINCWLLRMYAHWKMFSGSKHEAIITFIIVLESKNPMYSLLNSVCCKTSCDGRSLRLELKHTWLVDLYGCMHTENPFWLTTWTSNYVYCSSGVEKIFLAEFRVLRNFCDS